LAFANVFQPTYEGEIIMPVCSTKDWTIDLITGSGVIGSPVFTNITITGGTVSGDVHLPIGTRISGLAGQCVPLIGLPDTAAVTFKFRLRDAVSEIGILMSGVGFLPSGQTDAEFSGTWIAHPPVTDTPAADQDAGLVLPGSGDTGTGTGMQT
jgi:hypothetical protein